MEQINSNDVNTNNDSLNREDSDDIIDLTGDDEADVSDDTICLNYSQDATLDRYIITTGVVFHNWRTNSSDLMENYSLIFNEGDTSSFSMENINVEGMSRVLYQNVENAAPNNEIVQSLDVEMNEPFNEEIDEDSSISTSQLEKNDGSSHSSCDKIDNDEIIYSMENNEYALEFESRLGIINDIEYPVLPVQHVEHAVQLVDNAVQPVENAVQPVENAVQSVENAVSISLLSGDEDEDEDNNTNRSPKKPEIAVVNFDNIHFIPTIDEQKMKMFPSYSQIVFEELIESLKRRCELQNTLGRGNFPFGITDLMKVFSPTKWLNDLVIDAYLKLIVSESINVQYLGTYFIVKLKLTKHKINLKSKKYNNLYSFDKILIPINPNQNHWALVVVVPKMSEIIYFNSFKNIPKFELALLQNFFLKYDSFIYPMMQPRKWHIKNGVSPLQNNTYDCGIFTCTNARYVAFNKPLLYTQDDIPLARHRITYELLNETLIPFTDL